MYYVDEYKADRNRYETMQYNRCGKSGLKLPVVSLGLWHNFGSKDNYDMMKTLCFTAFDITMVRSMDLQRKKIEKIKKLDAIAKERGQSLPQMALSWLLKDSDVTSVLIGASKPEQILSNIGIIGHTTFTKEELDLIDQISKEQ